jgi:hypothetical protein
MQDRIPSFVANVEAIVKDKVKDLATKDGLDHVTESMGTLTERVDNLIESTQDLTHSFTKMAYNDRARAINKARLRLASTHPGGGIIPLVPLLDKEGLFVPIRWASEIMAGTYAAVETWAARFGLDPVNPINGTRLEGATGRFPCFSKSAHRVKLKQADFWFNRK